MPAVTRMTASPPGLSPESLDPVPWGAGRAENARDPQGVCPALPRRELRWAGGPGPTSGRWRSRVSGCAAAGSGHAQGRWVWAPGSESGVLSRRLSYTSPGVSTGHPARPPPASGREAEGSPGQVLADEPRRRASEAA